MKTAMPAWLIGVLFASVAHAETYRVDLIVFLDKYAATEAGRRIDAANVANAIEPGDASQLAAAGITLLPESQFALNEEWQRLRNSKRYQPLLKLAWTQKDPPNDRGPAVRVRFGQAQAVSSATGLGASAVTPVDGSIALLLGHYLHLDVDLVYTSPEGVAWRLRENRKMKRDELHHLDSARLGVLAELSKVTAP